MFFLIGDGIQDSAMPPRTHKIKVRRRQHIICLLIICDISEGGDILLDMKNVTDVVFGRTTARRRNIGLNLIGFVKRQSWVPSIPPSI